MHDAVIVSAVRTAVGKAPAGTLRTTGLTRWRRSCCARRSRARPGSIPAEVDDVIMGCAMPEAEQGLNVARIASLRAGVPVSASAVTVNRFCSSGPAGDRVRRPSGSCAASPASSSRAAPSR